MELLGIYRFYYYVGKIRIGTSSVFLRVLAPAGDGLMGPFARKYGKRTGSEAWALVYLSAMSFGISVLLFLVDWGS